MSAALAFRKLIGLTREGWRVAPLPEFE